MLTSFPTVVKIFAKTFASDVGGLSFKEKKKQNHKIETV